MSRPHPRTAPTGKIGFLSATQIPVMPASTSGGFWGRAESSNGDFNGDGKQDLVSIVQDDSANIYVSVVLSNGDGTFQPAILTPVPGNDFVAFAVGDLNGDGKDDVVIIHSVGYNSSTTSTFDVLLSDSNGDGNFAVGSTTFNLGTTNGLIGGTLQDVNGDGKLDAVVVDSGSPNVVWTLLGNGDGTFASTATPSTALSGTENQALLTDMNGDGKLDVVGYNSGTGTIDVYLAQSATTYAAAASYTADSNICNFTTGDLNGDTKPEVVTSNCSDDDLSIFVNNGDGSLQTMVNYFVGGNASGNTVAAADLYPEAATIADVNGDGFPDIISSNDDGSDVTVLLGNGDGTVIVPTVGYATGGYPQTAAIVADFNGDGFADIAVPDDEFSYAYLKGYGDGTFRAALDYYAATTVSNTYGLGIATGDFNGDGQPDFVIGNICYSCTATTPQGITVFLSRADGSLQPGVTYGTSSSLEYVAVADFNGDGKLDIAASDTNNGIVQLFLGNGDGTFTAGASFPTDASSTGPTDLVVADFNKDGHPDLAVLNSRNNNIGVLINDGTGNFQTVVNYPLSNSVYAGITAADVNGDGNLDLLTPLSGSAAVALLAGNGDGTFSVTEVDIPVGGNYPEALAVADLNGDGTPDLAVTLDQGAGQDIALILGTGNGSFGTPTVIASSTQDFTLTYPYPEYIKAVDVDGDGVLDLIYDNSNYSTLGVIFGMGGGQFYAPVEYPVGGYPWGLATADVNQDGAPDVVIASDDASAVTVLLNNNGSGPQPNFTFGATQNSATVSAGGSATFNLMLTPINHYNGTVTFSCSGLPAKSTCTFNPASVSPNGTGQVSAQLTISTTAATAHLQAPALPGRRDSQNLLASLSSMGLFGLMFAGSMKKKQRRCMGILLAVALVAMIFSMVGCGSSSSGNNGGGTSGTPAGTYTVVVTANGTASNNGGGAVAQAMNLTLTVQ